MEIIKPIAPTKPVEPFLPPPKPYNPAPKTPKAPQAPKPAKAKLTAQSNRTYTKEEIKEMFEQIYNDSLEALGEILEMQVDVMAHRKFKVVASESEQEEEPKEGETEEEDNDKVKKEAGKKYTRAIYRKVRQAQIDKIIKTKKGREL
jgi:hypothetical protein